MDLNQQEAQAWKAFLDARAQRQNLSNINHEFGYFEFDDSIFEYPVSEELRSLLLRAKELSKEFEKFQSEINEFYQNAAWNYMAIAFDLGRGDQIEVNNEGRTEIIYCDSVWCDYGDRAEFAVSGAIARKDGSAGMRIGYCRLTVGNWRIVMKAPKNILALP